MGRASPVLRRPWGLVLLADEPQALGTQPGEPGGGTQARDGIPTCPHVLPATVTGLPASSQGLRCRGCWEGRGEAGSGVGSCARSAPGAGGDSSCLNTLTPPRLGAWMVGGGCPVPAWGPGPPGPTGHTGWWGPLWAAAGGFLPGPHGLQVWGRSGPRWPSHSGLQSPTPPPGRPQAPVPAPPAQRGLVATTSQERLASLGRWGSSVTHQA